MLTKANLIKAVLQIVLRKRFECFSITPTDKFVYHTCFSMTVLRLRVPRFKSWTFTDTTKLLDLFETSSVMPTKTIMTLGVSDDEGNKWV